MSALLKRATTPAKKRAVIARLFMTWMKNPELRLGQLIVNTVESACTTTDIFYIEDKTIKELLETYNAES